MKELETKIAFIEDGRIVCSHCALPQEKVGDVLPGNYECENCWNHFAVTQSLLETKKEIDLTPINKNLEILHERLKVVEKQLGIR